MESLIKQCSADNIMAFKLNIFGNKLKVIKLTMHQSQKSDMYCTVGTGVIASCERRLLVVSLLFIYCLNYFKSCLIDSDLKQCKRVLKMHFT